MSFSGVTSSLATTEGSTHDYHAFNTGPIRYQQVYNGSAFGAGPISINQIAFRPDFVGGRDTTFVAGKPFTFTFADIDIRLSTSARSADGLSRTFADNIGPDSTLVYSARRDGPLTLSSAFVGDPGAPREFDIVIGFAVPFQFDPAGGNLLLDITRLSAGVGPDGAPVPWGTVGFDAQTSVVPGHVVQDSTSRLFSQVGRPGDATGTPDSAGLVTRFGTTPLHAPEPAGLFVFGAVLAGGAYARRRALQRAAA